MSFQELGLLPALGEIRSSQSGHITLDLIFFEDVPSDHALCLFGLARLDLASARKYPSTHSSLPFSFSSI